MNTKDLNDRIDEFYKSKGFKKIKSPGFVFVKSNGIRTVYIILKTKAIPAFNEFYIVSIDTSVIFNEIARVASLKPQKSKTLNRGFGMTQQTFNNIEKGGGYHKLIIPIKIPIKLPYSFDELDRELDKIYENDVSAIDELIPDLFTLNTLLSKISFNKEFIRNTVHGNLYIFKLLVSYFTQDSAYGRYKIEIISQTENLIDIENDNHEIEYLNKELVLIKSIITQLEKEKTINNNL